jgi:hypothetical protein
MMVTTVQYCTVLYDYDYECAMAEGVALVVVVVVVERVALQRMQRLLDRWKQTEYCMTQRNSGIDLFAFCLGGVDIPSQN